MAQVKTQADASQHTRVFIGYIIPQNSRWFTRYNAGSFSPYPSHGGKAGCRKEQYDANVSSCEHYKRQGFFWRTVLYFCRDGWFQERSKDLRNQNKTLTVGTKWQMNGDLCELCDIFLCPCSMAKKELVPKKQGRGCACHMCKT